MALKVGKLVKDWGERLGAPGVAAGIGAIVLAPLVIPVVAKVAKPIAKAAIKGGIVAYEKTKIIMAETGEALEDIVAEVKAELAEEEAQGEVTESGREINRQ
jgi:F0F1-type ATP synthase epsilon subunit